MKFNFDSISKMENNIFVLLVVLRKTQLLLKKIAILFILFFSIKNTKAQTVRNYSNEFLNIGVGAKALAMGKAVSSFTEGVEAGYWNPAGTISVQDFEFAAMHNSLYGGIGSYDYFGAALPIERDDIGLAVSVIRLGIDDILNTTALIDSSGNIDFNNVYSFTSSDVAAILSISKSLKHFSVGANAKIIRRNIGSFAIANGFGFDVGAQFKKGNFKAGLVIRDITTTFTAWNIEDYIFEAVSAAQTNEDGVNNEAPEEIELTLPKFQLGISYQAKLNEKYSLLTSADIIGRFFETNDIISTSFASFSPSIGLELNYKNKAFLRGGTSNFQNEVDFNNTTNFTFEPSIGIGIAFKSVSLDYALTNVGADSGINYSNVFSLIVKLNEIR